MNMWRICRGSQIPFHTGLRVCLSVLDPDIKLTRFLLHEFHFEVAARRKPLSFSREASLTVGHLCGVAEHKAWHYTLPEPLAAHTADTANNGCKNLHKPIAAQSWSTMTFLRNGLPSGSESKALLRIWIRSLKGKPKFQSQTKDERLQSA